MGRQVDRERAQRKELRSCTKFQFALTASRSSLPGYASSARASVLVLLEEIIRLRAALKDAKKRLRGAGMLGSDEML